MCTYSTYLPPNTLGADETFRVYARACCVHSQGLGGKYEALNGLLERVETRVQTLEDAPPAGPQPAAPSTTSTTTHTTTKTTSTTTTITTTTTALCNGKGDPADCRIKYDGNCADIVIGESVQKSCPVMCASCPATTTPTPPTMVTTTTSSATTLNVPKEIADIVAAFARMAARVDAVEAENVELKRDQVRPASTRTHVHAHPGLARTC